MKITFPSFAKGLVGKDSIAKLGGEYNQKCSELHNFYIHQDDTLRRRPPLTSVDSPLSELRGIIDVQTSQQKLYVLTNVQVDQLDLLPTELRKVLGLPSLLGTNQLSSLYQLVDGQLRGEREVALTDGVVNLSLRAHVQRVYVFDAATRAPLPEEGYTLASVHHQTEIDFQGQKMSLTARRASVAGQLPGNYEARDIEEPAVVMIFQGTGGNARRLSSAHTVSFKLNNQSSPSVLAENVEDLRTLFSPVLEESPEGQKEFVNADSANVTRPLDDLDVHPLGGVAFLFAGLYYRVHNEELVCENGPTLFPDLPNIGFDNLSSFIEDNVVGHDVNLPLKVLYMPAKHTATSATPTIYTQDNIQRALGVDLISSVGQRGFNQLIGVEKLLGEEQVQGFDYTVFRQLFPVLTQVLKGFKQVVGYYQNAITGATHMYPDVKYLVADSDINGAGETFPLYRGAGGTQRAARVMCSAPRLVTLGQAFKTQAPGTTEFPNGNGIAAGGIGVTVALYNDLDTRRDTDTGAIVQNNNAQQAPDGFLYFYVDYSSEQAKRFFKDVGVVSGFSASNQRYHSAALRKAAASPVKPAVRFESLLVNNMSTVDSGGNSATVYSAGQDLPTNERTLVYPFGPPLSTVENHGTPCYYISETPNEGAGVWSWELGRNLTEAVAGSPVTHTINQTLARYMVLPTTYKPAVGRLHILQGRSAITEQNKIHFSEVGELSKFSNPLARYWDSFTTASRSFNVLQASGVSGAVGTTPIDAETREFTDSTGRPADVVTVLGDSPNRTFIGTQSSIHRVLPNSFLGSDTGIQLNKIADYGISSNLVADSSYVVGALDNQVLSLRYYEEASGYIVDPINQETEIQDIDTLVSMVGKHRLVLLHKRGTNTVYAMSVDSNRSFKGFSVMTFPEAISRIKTITQDIVGCLMEDGTYAELDFRANEDTVYEDNINNRRSGYESSVATLPIVILDQKIASPDYAVTPRSITLGVHGYVDFTLSLLDDAGDTAQDTHLRYPEEGQIENARLFSGIYVHKGIGHTRSNAPRIRISKRDKRYLSLSSMILEVGSTG